MWVINLYTASIFAIVCIIFVILTNNQKAKNLKQLKMLDLFRAFNLKYNSLLWSVIFPIGVTGFFWLIILCGLGKQPNPNPLTPSISIILAPIYEEVIFRGLILGFLFVNIPKWLFDKFRWNNYDLFKPIVTTVGLIISSIYFSLIHDGNIDTRLLLGMFYGLFYLLDKQNLLPAIIAHSLNNIISTYVLSCPFFS